MSRLSFVAADATAAKRVPLVGANTLERAATLDVLAGFGAESGVRKVRFDDSAPRDPGHPGRRRAILVETRERSPLDAWRAQTLAEAVIARLRSQDETIAWDGIDRAGGGASGHALDRPAARRAALTALAGAGRAGFDAHATLYANGALIVALRLDERGFFAPKRTDWLHVVGFFDHSLAGAALTVAAPNGDVSFFAADGVCYATCAMPEAPTPGTTLPASMRGPTRLTIVVRDPFPDGRRKFSRLAGCDVGDATALQLAQQLCAAVIADRYALLPPQASDAMCAGGAFFSVQIRGELGGLPIRQEYGNCTNSTAIRWLEMFKRVGMLPAAWRL